MRIYRIILCLFLSASILGCSVQETSGIYGQDSNWYTNGKCIDPDKPDVFYILPTCVFDWKDENGNTVRYASLTDPEQREAMRPSYELADEIFGGSTNFFAPYYRQITLNVWGEGEEAVRKYFPKAMDDISQAFRYYMENWNNGRKFILAGFSQGAKCVVELLKEMSDEEYSRMAAAYVIGYRVTEEDIEASSGKIVPASSSDDTGVTICYNSVTDTDAIVPILCEGNILAINPVNWSTTSEPAVLNDSITVILDPVRKVLTVSGIDPDSAYHPSLADLFPKGNLHLLELTLYRDCLKANVTERF